MGRTHIEALRRLGNVEIAGIAATTVEKAQALASPFGIRNAVDDYRALIEDASIDTVHVCTPNVMHVEVTEAALRAGKHVLCEKPLALSSEEAARLIALARKYERRHATNHNLRYYPLVQQMRAMREAGELGDILIVQGTYSQDWLFHDTDWNWRIEAKEGGPSRTMADIGSHWCDMAEHVTGLLISELSADLQTFHKTRRRPKGQVETFTTDSAVERTEVSVDTEDFGSVQFHMGERTRGMFTASQVSGGRKNQLKLEIYGTKASVSWDQERPDELWIGSRDSANRTMIKDASVMELSARSFADYPPGLSEGYADTFKQLFRRFYRSIATPGSAPEYPVFDDGLRQLKLIEAELESAERHAWVKI